MKEVETFVGSLIKELGDFPATLGILLAERFQDFEHSVAPVLPVTFNAPEPNNQVLLVSSVLHEECILAFDLLHIGKPCATHDIGFGPDLVFSVHKLTNPVVFVLIKSLGRLRFPLLDEELKVLQLLPLLGFFLLFNRGQRLLLVFICFLDYRGLPKSCLELILLVELQN